MGLPTSIDSLREENDRLRRELRVARETCTLLDRHIAIDALERLRATDTTANSGRRLRPVT